MFSSRLGGSEIIRFGFGGSSLRSTQRNKITAKLNFPNLLPSIPFFSSSSLMSSSSPRVSSFVRSTQSSLLKLPSSMPTYLPCAPPIVRSIQSLPSIKPSSIAAYFAMASVVAVIASFDDADSSNSTECESTLSLNKGLLFAAAVLCEAVETPSIRDPIIPYKRMNWPQETKSDSNPVAVPPPNHAIHGALGGNQRIRRFDVYRRIDDVVELDGEREKSHDLTTGSTDIGKEVVKVEIEVGSELDGHNGVVHGGITALLFDESMGWGCEEVRRRMLLSSPSLSLSETTPKNLSKHPKSSKNIAEGAMVVTAKLDVNYRRPFISPSSISGTHSAVTIRVYHERTEGRKIYLRGEMEGIRCDCDNESSGSSSQKKTVLFSDASALFVLVPRMKK